MENLNYFYPVIILAFLGSIMMGFMYQSLLTIHFMPSYKHDLPIPKKEAPPKRVLFYTSWLGNTLWWGGKTIDYDIKKCRVSNCVFSSNRTQIGESDAVFFHAKSMLPPDSLRKLREKKGKNQLWIWSIFESPVHVPLDLSQYNNIFDWTATYRNDSEMFLPYYRTLPLSPEDTKPQPERNFADGKDKVVMAAISNCVGPRIEMVKKLRQYVAFDLYGGCSKRIPQNLTESCTRFTRQCDRLKARYKFYFAMENSFCLDYISEKFYHNGLQMGLVPIVFGGKGGPDYTNILSAPPNSFINALDFKDLKSLGDHLNYLNSNDTAYNEYHAWRYKYKVEYGWTMCEVCDYGIHLKQKLE